MKNNSSNNVFLSSIKKVYQSFFELEKTKGIDRSRAVKAMAKAIKNSADEILEANTIDLETSKEMSVSDLLIDWLKLTPERLNHAIEILEQLADLSDPLERVINASYQLQLGQTYCQRKPLGVIALIYETFPELGIITAGLCVKSGNALILRGGSETSHSNTIIAQVLQTALEEANLPQNCLLFLSPEDGSSIQDLVTKDKYINLVIPYGRPSLLQQVTELSTIPVLKSAMSNCYLYWSSSGDLDLVRSVIIDSHASQPDPVNAIEKVLINSNHKPSSLIRLFNNLIEKGFKLRGDHDLVQDFPEQLTLVQKGEWGKPYLGKIIAFKKIEKIEHAIKWINHYSSCHADCLITESYSESRQFAMEVDSALIYINSSPRFSRNPKGGEAVFLGVSNQKGNRRGLIGLESFTTLKQVVQG
jgi:glutamate-5-semialdehyde dehydrogenase